MVKRLIPIFAVLSLMLAISPAWADEYQDTINVFKKATESSAFFKTAYGYAVFPTIGKGGGPQTQPYALPVGRCAARRAGIGNQPRTRIDKPRFYDH